MVEFKTERLILRPWKEEDLKPFASLNADLRVREFFPGLLTTEESNASVKLLKEHIQRFGFGLWATTLIDTGEFIGFIGLQKVDFESPLIKPDSVEIGWRLSVDHWGKGYATEGALEVVKYAFNSLNLNEIIAFVSVKNKRSRNVMEKLGMHYDVKDEFDHPKYGSDHLMKRHAIYRLLSSEFKTLNE